MIRDFDSDSRFYKDFPKMWEDMISNDGEIPLPDSFDYVPTLRCNLKCPGCFQDKCRFKKNDELSLSDFVHILNDLDVKDKIFKLIGGEVFVRNDITNMLDVLTAHGANIILGTNALKTPDTNTFLKRNWNIVEITTSIDGLARTHDSMRGIQGAFKRVRDFIYEMGNYGLGYKILTTTMMYDNNLHEMEELMKLKDLLGIERMRFQIPKWSSQEEIDETKRILGKDTILDVSRVPYKYDDLPFPFMWELPKGYYLQPDDINRFPVETLNKSIRKNHKCVCKYLFRGKINPDGSVNPCFYILNDMGNLKDKSMEEIWDSKKYKEFRMKLANGNLTPICENCCSVMVDYDSYYY